MPATFGGYFYLQHNLDNKKAGDYGLFPELQTQDSDNFIIFKY